ncbi:cupin domain-containing protein [Xenorhabdus doucetiae]|uniref:Auxin-binding protein n=1 Tax=Xenorhabdus doucetiae TaxID=351671 RepID=A0A068QRK5_9GAMM|nr:MULTISPECIES: cupin domain-containing protein [Xenorhabdus]MBD2786134.1 cupin domain-containing protein [Xenorhabdus sp. 3]MBD2788695.1 cupin domain-containing protein [Xenorhabdus sp. DI]MBD2797136.1 cupin domain-containing protein [Xenorhabdus sp. 18]TYO99762.1 putative cupin superfamily protein [Xenorhabdus doucetiae]CDG17618.1 Auxin-binding protein [Xenorhabdus doucetiae]
MIDEKPKYDFTIKNINEIELDNFERSPLYASRGGSLTEGTLACKLGASVDCVPAGKRAVPYHFHHSQEEMFIIISGSGTLRIADNMIPIKEGDVICIPAGEQYPHQIINTSDGLLRYLSISTMESPEICEYPDSNKYLAKSNINGVDKFSVINFLSKDVDYWENEP